MENAMSYQNQQPTYGGPATPGVRPMNPADEKQLMMAAHWSAIVSAAFVGLTFLGPLIVFLGWGNRSAAVRRHAADALNFQITSWLITIGLALVGVITLIFIIGIVPLIAAGFVWLVALVFHGIAAIRVYNGEDYRYPFTVHFIK